MATTTVYAAETDADISSITSATYPGGGGTYQKTRQGDTLSANDTGSLRVGQEWIYTTDKWSIFESLLQFDTSSITGTVDSATLGLYLQSDSSTAQEFTQNVRIYDYGAAVTTADWIAGGSLADYELAGTQASTGFAAGYNSTTVTDLDGALCPDTAAYVLSSSKHEAGESPGTDPNISYAGSVYWVSANSAGTTQDPKLTIVDGGNPTDCTINSPGYGSYDGTINLTATATDPNADTVRYHWDYSLNGAAYTACPNSPSGYVASGAAGTITFDLSAFALNDIIDLRVRAYDGALYSFDYETVRIARSGQSTVSIYRTAGDDLVSHPKSGMVVRRLLSAPSTLNFTIDNFDNIEGNVTDTDEIILYVPYYTVGAIGSYSWRGFVRSKRVGDLCEVECKDISYRFARTRVTRVMTAQTVGTVIKAIVEDPTGSNTTGITATCAEVDDPLNPGTYLTIANFDGQGRMLQDWLSEISDWTGCQWYVYHDGTTWQFVWFNPADNAAWSTAVLDSIGFEDESASQAKILNQPTVLTDREPYVNRVWYWYLSGGAQTLDSVETAAVTAGTEEPEEIVLSMVAVDQTAGDSLAQAYLDAYDQSRETVENAVLFGIRELALNKDVTLTLTPNAITATAYPLQGIEYHLLEQGHSTTLVLGDKTLNTQQAIERLLRRVSELQADVRY